MEFWATKGVGLSTEPARALLLGVMFQNSIPLLVSNRSEKLVAFQEFGLPTFLTSRSSIAKLLYAEAPHE